MSRTFIPSAAIPLRPTKTEALLFLGLLKNQTPDQTPDTPLPILRASMLRDDRRSHRVQGRCDRRLVQHGKESSPIASFDWR